MTFMKCAFAFPAGTFSQRRSVPSGSVEYLRRPDVPDDQGLLTNLSEPDWLKMANPDVDRDRCTNDRPRPLALKPAARSQ